MGFRQLDYEAAFVIMGATIMGSAALSVFINIKGHRGLFWGEDTIVGKEKKAVLVIPEQDDEAAEEVNA
jgi:hypothetical protein